MTGRRSCIAILAIFVTLFIPIVVSNDSDPIPSRTNQVNQWFQNNVQPYSTRKSTLDPDLVKAEENQRVIKVSQDGKGNFKTIKDAVKSIPDNNKQRVIVVISGGTYFEKVEIGSYKPFVTFYGKGMPTLVYNGTARSEGSTIKSATLIVLGNYFVAVNMIFKNSSPPPSPGTPGAQAVAVAASSDKSAFYNSKFIGFQDTLIDNDGQHFYMDCYIEGTVDFIWGFGKSIFLKTELHVVDPRVNVITANYRGSPSNNIGYSFVQCSVTGKSKNCTTLGRALYKYATVVFSYTNLSDAVSPQGWSSSDDDSKAFFGEYKNRGPGTQGTRASFIKKLNDVEAKQFLTLSYIQGSKWLLPPPKF